MKVTAKLRSGASVPSQPRVDRDAEQEDADRAADDLRRAGRAGPARAPRRAGAGRSSSKRGSRQAAESAKKETIRTIDAPQANSQAGIGRSSRATSAWANGRTWIGHRFARGLYGLTRQLEDLLAAVRSQLGLEDPFDRRPGSRSSPSRRPRRPSRCRSRGRGSRRLTSELTLKRTSSPSSTAISAIPPTGLPVLSTTIVGTAGFAGGCVGGLGAGGLRGGLASRWSLSPDLVLAVVLEDDEQDDGEQRPRRFPAGPVQCSISSKAPSLVRRRAGASSAAAGAADVVASERAAAGAGRGRRRSGGRRRRRRSEAAAGDERAARPRRPAGRAGRSARRGGRSPRSPGNGRAAAPRAGASSGSRGDQQLGHRP